MDMQTPGKRPTFSIIVPVWNRELQIKLCLEALIRQTYPAELFEIIVVDNGSTDGTPEAVGAFPQVRLLQDPTPGSYRARNLGIDVATGDYLAFTDSDCLPSPDWLSTAAAAIADDPGVAVFGGAIKLFAGARDRASCQFYEARLSMQQEAAIRDGRCITANWVSPSWLIRQCGGFDAALMSGGDSLLARQIHTSGRTLRYVPAMVVYHPTRGRIVDLIKKRRRIMGGHWHKLGSGLPRLRYIFGRCWRLPLNFFRAFTYRELKLVDQVRLGGLFVILNVVDIAETISLAMGGQERRE